MKRRLLPPRQIACRRIRATRRTVCRRGPQKSKLGEGVGHLALSDGDDLSDGGNDQLDGVDERRKKFLHRFPLLS